MGSNHGIEVIARGLMRVDSEILLCRSMKKGYAYLPGGHVDPGETAAEACAREFLEETGMAIEVGASLLICEVIFEQEGEPRHEINVVFHVEHAHVSSLEPDEIKASAVSREPMIEFSWTDLAAVSDLDIRPAVIRAWLASGGGVESENRPNWLTSRE